MKLKQALIDDVVQLIEVATELTEKIIRFFGRDLEPLGALHEYYQSENSEPKITVRIVRGYKASRKLMHSALDNIILRGFIKRHK